MDKIREEFEAWFEANHKTENASFNFAIGEAMWDSWRASRAVLRVELPEHCEGLSLTVSELRKQLKKVGVSLK